MKRILALVLAAIFVVLTLSSCTKIGVDGNGAEIDIYMGTKVQDLDPAIAYTDENTVAILNLIFEGLFRMNSNGSVSKAMCRKYEVYDNERTGNKEIKIIINESHWSDGSEVQANDFVYAWRRILNPDFSSPAASMLYAIKGAKDAKLGINGTSIYDIGVYASAKDTIIVELEDGTDVDEFIRCLASPALVPLRENKIDLYRDTWSKSSTDLSTNGPFRVKKFSSDPTEVMVLQRSKYYYLNLQTNTEDADKYVTPYRINIHFDTPVDLNLVYSKDATESVVEQYANKQLFYLSGLTAAVTSANGYKVKTEDASSTFSYIFNCKKGALANADVRKALSIALDRDYIASIVGMNTKAATSLLPSMVFNTKRGTSFSKESGVIIPSTSQLEEAQNLIASSGISKNKLGTIELYYRTDSVNDSARSDAMGYQSKERAVAQYTEEVWESLGFNVVLKPVSDADLNARYQSGSYDVIAIDFQAISADPFYNLAQFSTDFSGTTKLISSKDAGFDASLGLDLYYVSQPHLSGYSSSAYDELINKAYVEKDVKTKAQILHEAEKVLLEEGGICPIIKNTTSYISQELSGIKTSFWGTTIFTKVSLKNYEVYNGHVEG